MTFDEMIDEDISVTNDYTRRAGDYFHIDIKYADKCVLVDCKQPFKHPKLARLKFFYQLEQDSIPLIQRYYILIMLYKFIRIVWFTIKKFDDVTTAYKSYPTLRPEAKSTGYLIWHNVQSCEPVKTE